MLGVEFSNAASYTIEHHQHRFAAWAASRAASFGCHFKVEQGREILEECGFAGLAKPEQLPSPDRIDMGHRHWRGKIIEAANTRGKSFTHGIAAKLINVYLKSRFVCGGHHSDERVRNLHPPIDRELLATLARLNVGGYGKRWSEHNWTELDSDQYEQLIAFIRDSLKGKPLWMIEEHWKGNQ